MKSARLNVLGVSSVVVGCLLQFGWFVNPALAQFRSFTPIASPRSYVSGLPAGTVAVEQLVPLRRSEIESRLEKIIEQWNNPGMAATLAEEFYDRTRLLDAVNTDIPRDAKLRILSIQSVRTLRQYQVPAMNGEAEINVSIVSATARTQLEFNSPTGFVRLPGTNEFILRITKPAPRN
jgi:hypothetical protein